MATPDALTLSDSQLDVLADRIAGRLGAAGPQNGQLVDAATLARALGVDRSWVYARAAELGAIRLGKGTRGVPLRFDLERAREACSSVSEPQAPPRARPRRPKTSDVPGSILGSRPPTPA
jgi:hypothetical protein